MTARCGHEMLPGQCSICKGLPYNPPMQPLAEFEPALPTEDTTPRVQWIPLEERVECVACEKALDRGQRAAWVDQYGGPVGECCREWVAA